MEIEKHTGGWEQPSFLSTNMTPDYMPDACTICEHVIILDIHFKHYSVVPTIISERLLYAMSRVQ